MGCSSSKPSVVEKPATTSQKQVSEAQNQATPKAVNSRLDTQAKDSSAKPVYQSRVKQHANAESLAIASGQAEQATLPAEGTNIASSEVKTPLLISFALLK